MLFSLLKGIWQSKQVYLHLFSAGGDVTWGSIRAMLIFFSAMSKKWCIISIIISLEPSTSDLRSSSENFICSFMNDSLSFKESLNNSYVIFSLCILWKHPCHITKSRCIGPWRSVTCPNIFFVIYISLRWHFWPSSMYCFELHAAYNPQLAQQYEWKSKKQNAPMWSDLGVRKNAHTILLLWWTEIYLQNKLIMKQNLQNGW